MSEEQTRTLSLKAAYAFGATHGLENEIRAIREMPIQWDSSYTDSLRRGYIVALFEEHGIFDAFKSEYWSFGNSASGETMRRRFLRIRSRYEDFLAGIGSPPLEEMELQESSDVEQASQFALEAHLRDFLAKNLDRIEPGLKLYTSQDRNGVEFPVDGGRIDLLAVDRNGQYVVVELKLSQGRNKALGQLLYYMGWVDQNLGHRPCRGLIIASDISDELSIAVSRAAGVRLAKYRMTFSIELIGSPTSLNSDK